MTKRRRAEREGGRERERERERGSGRGSERAKERGTMRESVFTAVKISMQDLRLWIPRCRLCGGRRGLDD